MRLLRFAGVIKTPITGFHEPAESHHCIYVPEYTNFSNCWQEFWALRFVLLQLDLDMFVGVGRECPMFDLNDSFSMHQIFFIADKMIYDNRLLGENDLEKMIRSKLGEIGECHRLVGMISKVAHCQTGQSSLTTFITYLLQK